MDTTLEIIALIGGILNAVSLYILDSKNKISKPMFITGAILMMAMPIELAHNKTDLVILNLIIFIVVYSLTYRLIFQRR